MPKSLRTLAAFDNAFLHLRIPTSTDNLNPVSECICSLPDFTVDRYSTRKTPAPWLCRGNCGWTHPRPRISSSMYFIIGFSMFTIVPEGNKMEKCKIFTLKQRSHLPGDTKGSPTVWGYKPFVVSWVTTTATTTATGSTRRQATPQQKRLSQKLIFYSSLKRKLNTGRCIHRRQRPEENRYQGK